MGISLLLAMAGGSLGAILRYGISQGIFKIYWGRFPLATLLVNGIGSFLIGILAGIGVEGNFWVLAGIGILGGLTTFSTFQKENWALFRKRAYPILFLYGALSVVICLTGVWFGYRLI